MDADGNIAITGGDLSDSGDRMYTAKFASADGDLMWEDWIAAPLPLGDAEGSRVVSLPNGDIAALGRRGPETVNQAPGAYIVRYEAGTGAELWSMRYDLFPGPSTAHLDLSRIVFDPSDESLVFGTAIVAFTVSSSRSATYKVDAGSGLVLWQLTHTNLNFPYFAYKADLLALSGESRSNDAVAQLFRGGPELTVQWVNGEVEFSWPEQYQGWRLQHLNTNDSLAGTWSTVPGSEDAVSVRVPVTEGSLGLFQLAR